MLSLNTLCEYFYIKSTSSSLMILDNKASVLSMLKITLDLKFFSE